jgi:hypothetical protein
MPKTYGLVHTFALDMRKYDFNAKTFDAIAEYQLPEHIARETSSTRQPGSTVGVILASSDGIEGLLKKKRKMEAEGYAETSIIELGPWVRSLLPEGRCKFRRDPVFNEPDSFKLAAIHDANEDEQRPLDPDTLRFLNEFTFKYLNKHNK